jgi:hypothetical protein
MDNNISHIDSYYKFEYKNITYEINDVSPLLELKRHELMKSIKKKCKDYFLENNLLNLDINNILPRWIMLQFKNKSYYIDPLLPFNAGDNEQLKKDIRILSKLDLSEADVNKIIKDINLKKRMNDAILELKKYMKSDFYIKHHKNIKINVESDDNFYYYSFDSSVDLNSEIMNISSLKFKLHKTVVKKIFEEYKMGTKNIPFKRLIFCILLRYNTLESYNQQLAVLPAFYDYLHQEYNVNFELFASSINSHFTNYCSLFYDLEKYFNSKGNFNLLNIKKGFYTANPPFDEEIMNNMALKLISSLDQKENELSVLITIPVWDNPEYGEFRALELLKKSGYIKYIEKVDKVRARFFDYYKSKFLNPCSIYIILIQNEKGCKKYPIANKLKEILETYFPKK